MEQQPLEAQPPAEVFAEIGEEARRANIAHVSEQAARHRDSDDPYCPLDGDTPLHLLDAIPIVLLLLFLEGCRRVAERLGEIAADTLPALGQMSPERFGGWIVWAALSCLFAAIALGLWGVFRPIRGWTWQRRARALRDACAAMAAYAALGAGVEALTGWQLPQSLLHGIWE